MLCRTKTLREAERRAERREQQLLGMIRDLQDRLMLMAEKPWTLPPRPVMDDVVDERELEEQREREFYEPV